MCACAYCVHACACACVCACTNPPTPTGVTSSKKPSLTFFLWVLGPERKRLSELGSDPPAPTTAPLSPFLRVAGHSAWGFSLLSVLACGLVHPSVDGGSFHLFHRPECPGSSFHIWVPCPASSPLPPSACTCDSLSRTGLGYLSCLTCIQRVQMPGVSSPPSQGVVIQDLAQAPGLRSGRLRGTR